MVHICGHYFNLTNLTESFSTDVAKIEQHLSQLDNPWLNPIREVGVVSLFIVVFYTYSTNNSMIKSRQLRVLYLTLNTLLQN